MNMYMNCKKKRNSRVLGGLETREYMPELKNVHLTIIQLKKIPNQLQVLFIKKINKIPYNIKFEVELTAFRKKKICRSFYSLLHINY